MAVIDPNDLGIQSTIATALEQHLLHQKLHAFRLDGDNVRFGLNKVRPSQRSLDVAARFRRCQADRRARSCARRTSASALRTARRTSVG